MDKIDQLWPGWDVVQILGQGSFGAVYEIRRNLYGRLESAALKVISVPQSTQEVRDLRSEGYDDASITAHFQSYLEEIVREYTVMLELKGHTNVVYCDDIRYVQHEDGFGWDVFIKMELLTPLMNFMGRNYEEQQVVRMGIDLCNALILCKKENIVHRDIKPQNIFVSKTGDYKLGDFGVAKVSDRTVSGTKIGTYKYMAPEVYLNKPYGSSSDLYALGLVLYWAMNERRTPFLPQPPQMPKPSEEEEARQRRFSGEPIPTPVHGTRELQEIVLKACAYDPKDRFRDPSEMRDALLRLTAGEEIVSQDEKTVGVFRPRTAPIPEKEPEDATVGVFGNAAWQQPNPVTETVKEVPAEKPQQTPEVKSVSSPAENIDFKDLNQLFGEYFGNNDSGNQVKVTQKIPGFEEKQNIKENKVRKGLVTSGIFAAIAAVILLVVLIAKGGADKKKLSANDLQLVPKLMTNSVTICGNSIAAVRNDGTVVYAGGNEQISADISTWTNIISVYGADYDPPSESEQGDVSYMVGLRSDGTVAWAGFDENIDEYELQNWTDIVDLAVGRDHIVGLRSDGTVVVNGRNDDGECDVSDWTDIVDVEIGEDSYYGGACTLGLKSDGTVVATGWNLYKSLDVEDWTDIVALSANNKCSVGLRSDGTVVVASNYGKSRSGKSYYGQYLYGYDELTDIVAMDLCNDTLITLNADGVVQETVDKYPVGDYGSWEEIIYGVRGVTDIAAVTCCSGGIILQKNTGELLYYGTNENLKNVFQENAHLFTDISLPQSVYDSMEKNTQHGEAWAPNMMDNFTTNLAMVTRESPTFGNPNIPRGDVLAVFFLDRLAGLDEIDLVDMWDVSQERDGSVMAGAMQEPDGRYQIYVAADNGINGSIACKGMFHSFSRLEAVSFENAFHTDTCTDMSEMFSGCAELILVDCEKLQTGKVTNMKEMFNTCVSLESLDISGWDTSSVTDMRGMFYCCTCLTEEIIMLALTNWDVSAVIDYEGFADGSYFDGDYVEFFEALAG